MSDTDTDTPALHSKSVNPIKWQIIHLSDNAIDSNWIEEEERLLVWTESPDFEKHPLSKIDITFMYVDADNSVVGIIKSELGLETHAFSSILNKPVFFEMVNQAANPKTCVSTSVNPIIPERRISTGIEGETDGGSFVGEWLEKTYSFEEAAIYSISVNHEQLDTFIPKRTCKPLFFLKDAVKIPSSLVVFHDLYEIFVIMREATNPLLELKSILKPATSLIRPGKTKKVRISDECPSEYVFSKHLPVSGKRRTKRVHR
jgi:hypothetical protein